MNCPSRKDTEPLQDEGYNQNPPTFSAELTTREDLNGRANAREIDLDISNADLDGRDVDKQHMDTLSEEAPRGDTKQACVSRVAQTPGGANAGSTRSTHKAMQSIVNALGDLRNSADVLGKNALRVFVKYCKFVGPGFMVAVAYIDPGNYATDVAAGASYRFKLLFIILMSNLFAIFFQSLCIKLGSVTGMNLAENCKAHLPKWLNYVLYFFAESAIIATDIAEVIGTAIALNVLLHVPLVAGCAISIVDVLIILVFYQPSGSMRALRAFEFFVMALVLGVVICFCFQLSLIKGSSVGEVFRGYLPSSAIVESQGLYQSCGILGATVMPHSLFLGSGIVQARLKEFDVRAASANSTNSNLPLDPDETDAEEEEVKYRPSLAAIKSCMSYSVAELAISLFTFALFVNSAILIVAGASLYNTPDAQDADLFGIHDLLSSTLSPVAGTIFALALLLSGTSAGIICTISGQMVSEGMLNWSCRPWIRRLVTRSISITPSIIIAGAIGRDGLSTALEASQVVLSVILPFVSAPLIWFTFKSGIMSVVVEDTVRAEPATRENVETSVGNGIGDAGTVEQATRHTTVCMRNHWITNSIALVVWGIIVIMNVALLVLVGLGKS